MVGNGYITQRKVDTETSKRLREIKGQERFIKGPIPLSWISRASKLNGKVLHIGLSLWYLSGLRKEKRIKLTSAVYTEIFGVSRQAMYRSLEKMEDAGLISAEQRQGKTFMVTILDEKGGEKMINNQVNQEAEVIKDCCNKIEAAKSSQNVQQELQKIKECCSKIEQNLS